MAVVKSTYDVGTAQAPVEGIAQCSTHYQQLYPADASLLQLQACIDASMHE